MSTLTLLWVNLIHKTDNSVIRYLKCEWLFLAIGCLIGLLFGFSPDFSIIESLNLGINLMLFISLFIVIRSDKFVPEDDTETSRKKINEEKKYAYPLYKLTIITVIVIFAISNIYKHFLS